MINGAPSPAVAAPSSAPAFFTAHRSQSGSPTDAGYHHPPPHSGLPTPVHHRQYYDHHPAYYPSQHDIASAHAHSRPSTAGSSDGHLAFTRLPPLRAGPHSAPPHGRFPDDAYASVYSARSSRPPSPSLYTAEPPVPTPSRPDDDDADRSPPKSAANKSKKKRSAPADKDAAANAKADGGDDDGEPAAGTYHSQPDSLPAHSSTTPVTPTGSDGVTKTERGGGGASGTTTTATRRMAHLLSEQKRRESINSGFDDLKHVLFSAEANVDALLRDPREPLVPAKSEAERIKDEGEDGAPAKSKGGAGAHGAESKAGLLRRAVTYIRTLESAVTQLQAHINADDWDSHHRHHHHHHHHHHPAAPPPPLGAPPHTYPSLPPSASYPIYPHLPPMTDRDRRTSLYSQPPDECVPSTSHPPDTHNPPSSSYAPPPEPTSPFGPEPMPIKHEADPAQETAYRKHLDGRGGQAARDATERYNRDLEREMRERKEEEERRKKRKKRGGDGEVDDDDDDDDDDDEEEVGRGSKKRSRAVAEQKQEKEEGEEEEYDNGKGKATRKKKELAIDALHADERAEAESKVGKKRRRSRSGRGRRYSYSPRRLRCELWSPPSPSSRDDERGRHRPPTLPSLRPTGTGPDDGSYAPITHPYGHPAAAGSFGNNHHHIHQQVVGAGYGTGTGGSPPSSYSPHRYPAHAHHHHHPYPPVGAGGYASPSSTSPPSSYYYTPSAARASFDRHLHHLPPHNGGRSSSSFHPLPHLAPPSVCVGVGVGVCGAGEVRTTCTQESSSRSTDRSGEEAESDEDDDDDDDEGGANGAKRKEEPSFQNGEAEVDELAD